MYNILKRQIGVVKVKRIIAFLCFVTFVFAFVACGKSGKLSDKIKDSVGKQSSGKIEKILLSPFGDRIYLKTYEIKTDYLSVTYNGNLSADDIIFKCDDEDIAKVRYVSTPLDGCICYSIEGVHYGTTYIHIESADGNIRAKKIKVVVDMETVTTTVPLSRRTGIFNGPDGEFFDLKPSTRSTKEDDEDDETTTSRTERTDESTSSTRSTQSTKTTHSSSPTHTPTAPPTQTQPTAPPTPPPTDPPTSPPTLPPTQPPTAPPTQSVDY